MSFTVNRKPRFDRDFRKLDSQVQIQVSAAIDDLINGNLVGRRKHDLQGFINPKVYKIDAAFGKRFAISFEQDGDVITLRRVAVHQQIDAKP